MSVTMLFAVFSDAQGVRGVLYVCATKSRLSSHGSSACPRRTTFVLQNVNYPATGKLRGRPWRTTFVLQKSTFQTRGSSGRPRRTPFVLQKSTFQPRKLRVSAAYYVCTTKIDFPATEAPGVRGVLRLYYKKSTLQPRKSPAYYVCTTRVEKQKTQKHDGFGTATTRKPAEGLRLYVRKRKNTTVLAPRQRRHPQRGYVCMSKNAKTRWFWHRANAETRRGLTRARKKCKKRWF